jgi:single-strand DNA-binding protein
MASRSLNKVLLICKLTRDPELRNTPSGTAVCTIGLATNRSWTSPEGGERNEETEFHRLVAWSKLAELCGQLLKKGRKVYVEGRLQTRKWTSQDGQEKQTTEIVMDNMIMLDAKPADGGDSSAYAYPSDSAASAPAAAKPAAKKKKKDEDVEEAPSEPVVAEDISDDIPF